MYLSLNSSLNSVQAFPWKAARRAGTLSPSDLPNKQPLQQNFRGTPDHGGAEAGTGNREPSVVAGAEWQGPRPGGAEWGSAHAEKRTGLRPVSEATGQAEGSDGEARERVHKRTTPHLGHTHPG